MTTNFSYPDQELFEGMQDANPLALVENKTTAKHREEARQQGLVLLGKSERGFIDCWLTSRTI